MNPLPIALRPSLQFTSLAFLLAASTQAQGEAKAGTASIEPITPVTAVADYQDWRREHPSADADEVSAKCDELLGRLAVSDLTGADLLQLRPLLWSPRAARPALQERIDALVADTGLDGALAAAAAIQLRFEPTTTRRRGMSAELRALWQRWLQHPGCRASIDAGVPWLFMLVYENADDQQACLPLVVALLRSMVGDLEATDVETTAQCFVQTRQMAGNRHADVDALRLQLVQRIEALAADDAGQRASLERRLAYLRGAAARGDLIGEPAPDLRFAWSSDGSTSLAAYRGKVVLLDFWSTDCVPCVHEFPQLAELVERYREHDVVLLGVTGTLAAAPAQDEGQRLARFRETKAMTWPIALLDGDVFHPDFVHVGIPHKAIIDPDGRVFANEGLGHTSIEQWCERIDRCLQAAGRTVPPAKR